MSHQVSARARLRTRPARPTRRILVPYDFSRPADRALKLATRLIGPGGEVQVVHVMTPFMPVGVMATEGAPWALAKDVFEAAQQQLKGRVATLTSGRRSPVVCRVDVGEPLHRIADAAKQVDAIVMATAGRTGALRLLIGSVAEKVVRHSPVPVITVRPSARLARNPFAKILVPHDFSTHADRALRLAASLAGARGRITVLHVAADLPEHASRLKLRPVILADARRRLERVALRIRASRGPRIECRVECGDPYRHIARAARGASSVVMSTAGRGGLAHLVIGSVTEKVVRHAPVPVLTFRPDARVETLVDLLGRPRARQATRKAGRGRPGPRA